MTQKFHIVNVLTSGVGLADWKLLNIYEREMSIWRNYVSHGWQVTLISSSQRDNHTEHEHRKNEGIDLLTLPNQSIARNFLINTNRKKMLRLHSFNRSDRKPLIIRTNQLSGSHIAYALSGLLQAPLIVRQGFNAVDNQIRENGSLHYRSLCFTAYERRYLQLAALCEFTTHASKESSKSRVSMARDAVIPNFVDTQTWLPRRNKIRQPRVTMGYFGRVVKEKNLSNLIIACSRIRNLGLEIIGEGSELTSLKVLARRTGAAVNFQPRMSASEVSRQMESWDFMICPSLYEGHPKTIIETMFKKIPIIGTPVSGISEALGYGKFGFLLPGTSWREIETGIRLVLREPPLRAAELVNNAYSHATTNFSVEVIGELQREVYSFLQNKVR
jgi:glycosyltransferase involved in cell wall biosynthesis